MPFPGVKKERERERERGREKERESESEEEKCARETNKVLEKALIFWGGQGAVSSFHSIHHSRPVPVSAGHPPRSSEEGESQLAEHC